MTVDESLQRYRLGWIGAGRMGYAMAGRLLRAGCRVTIYNRTRAKAEPLAALGATVVGSPADLADCDIVFTSVSTSDDLISVTSGPRGLFTAQKMPKLLIDCSSVSEEASSQVRAEAAKRGTYMLAAPVSGNAKVF
jgi:3-hydroxyisobutyrate dehydrogenase